MIVFNASSGVKFVSALRSGRARCHSGSDRGCVVFNQSRDGIDRSVRVSLGGHHRGRVRPRCTCCTCCTVTLDVVRIFLVVEMQAEEEQSRRVCIASHDIFCAVACGEKELER